MKVVLTGSSGRIGRAIFGALCADHDVIGIDRNVFSTTQVIGDCTDAAILNPVLSGAEAVIHTAGPHAPHVGVVPDAEFDRVNVEGTQSLIDCARAAGVTRFLYTSTTALYGQAIKPGLCTWVDEETRPLPRTIYHSTKLAAERMLEDAAGDAFKVRVLRMSRCFPEPAPHMAAYRLHRGIDARDVATGHALALIDDGAAFERLILSAATPFQPDDADALAHNAPEVIRQRAPNFAAAFEKRGWALPQSMDRVHDSTAAQQALGWTPRWDWREVLAQSDRDDLEVLPAGASITTRAE